MPIRFGGWNLDLFIFRKRKEDIGIEEWGGHLYLNQMMRGS